VIELIVVLKPETTEARVQEITERLEKRGFRVHHSQGEKRTLLGVIGHPEEGLSHSLEAMAEVEKVVPISRPYKLVSREFSPENSVIELNEQLSIGGKQIVVMAGPCAVEGEEQVLESAQEVKKAGAQVLRGGAFKPRTSPYSFQGMKGEGLEMLNRAREETGMLIITEVIDPHNVDKVARYSDILQVGTRNMQNFYLLQELSRIRKPVLLKRGMSATIEEWLMAAEYLMSGGNYQVLLCERGIRTFETYTRNTLDLSAVALAKQLTHLPVVVDPSHGTGRRELISAMSKAAVAAGADGLLLEVHPRPEEAFSDGPQSLTPGDFQQLMDELKGVASSVGRSI